MRRVQSEHFTTVAVDGEAPDPFTLADAKVKGSGDSAKLPQTGKFFSEGICNSQGPSCFSYRPEARYNFRDAAAPVNREDQEGYAFLRDENRFNIMAMGWLLWRAANTVPQCS